MLRPIQILKDMEKQNYISDIFPVTDILPDNKTCVTKHGTLVQVVKLDGKDYSSLSLSELERLFAERKTFFEKVDEELNLSVFACRRKYTEKQRRSDFGNEYAAHIASKLENKFRTSYKTEIYIVLKSPVETINSQIGIGSKKFVKEISALMGRANTLSGQVDVLLAALQSFKPKILEHKGNNQSELIGFWSYLLNGGTDAIAKTENTSNLNQVIGYSDIEFIPKEPSALIGKVKSTFKKYNGDEAFFSEVIKDISEEMSKGNYAYIRYTGADHVRFGAAMFLKYYPQESEYRVFEDLMSLQREFCLVQHFKMINKDVALEKTNLRINQLNQFGRFIGSLLGDLNDFANGLAADEFQQVMHSMHIIAYGDNPNETDDAVKAITSNLASKGINIKREEGNTEPVFWCQFPDYEDYAYAREVPIATITAADFCTFGAKPFGNTSCSWGDEPVAYFKADGANYAFTFHPTPERYVAGHTLCVGSTGSGKTVTNAYLLSQCLKYRGYGEEGRFKALIFDALNGLKVPVNAFGGTYIDIEDESGFIPLNPLQMPKSAKNTAFLERWIQSLAPDLDDRDKNAIERAVRTNYDTLDLPERSLYALKEAFGVTGYKEDGSPTLAQKLQKWIPHHGEPTLHNTFFNAPNDALDFKNQLVGFEMSFLKEDPELLAPLTSYLFHRFEDYIAHNPAPHMWFIDEAINFISNPILYPSIRRALKEWRKRNGVVVAAIQDLETLNTIDVGQEFLQSFQTYILFKDSQASPENYLGREGRAGVGLNENEFNWIKSHSTSKREVMIKRKSGESVILDIDLSDLGESLSLLRSDKEVLTAYENFKDQEDWQQHLMKAVRS